MRRLTLLGSTGSIGQSTLSVISEHPDRFQVFALAGNENCELMLRQVRDFRPVYAVMNSPKAAQWLRSQLKANGMNTEVLVGAEAIKQVADAEEVDIVVAAIVGSAGLAPTLAAVQAGKRVLLANKESLVMAGALFMDSVARHGAELLPVDSEHNAIFQCLPATRVSLADAGVRRLLLTASGGPFRKADPASLNQVTPDQACAHPNWQMGRKISVDSATMMNKGLEFIEACWLFGARPEQIDVLIHPQSIVHSMVDYDDGSVLAQLGQPDMRTPIAHCLGWPERLRSPVPSLDFTQLAQLEFYPPDFDRFPCLALAMAAMSAGGTAPAALNAANEVAVEAFLAGQLGFTKIADVVDSVMQSMDNCEPQSLEEVIHADRGARQMAVRAIERRPSAAGS